MIVKLNIKMLKYNYYQNVILYNLYLKLILINDCKIKYQNVKI